MYLCNCVFIQDKQYILHNAELGFKVDERIRVMYAFIFIYKLIYILYIWIIKLLTIRVQIQVT